MRLGTVVLLLAAALPVGACLWDTDTLAMEAKAFPDMVEVSVGRFERNPPLYYELRLARVAKALETSPERLELYDDAGVACDRLGRSNDALAWMARKAARLQPADAEHRYRYLANLGTFHVHRWLRCGANREQLADVRFARDLLTKAIELNPDAHFGRERHQLQAIRWIIDPPAPSPGHLSDFITANWRGAVTPEACSAAARGVAGLIVLGNAWESVDVYTALHRVLTMKGDASLARLAWLRATELASAGKRSLCPGAPLGADLARALNAGTPLGYALDAPQRNQVDAAFKSLRAAADRWQADRTAFMTRRLQAGRHPDTDPSFWYGWHDAKLPSLASFQPQPNGQRRRAPAKAARALDATPPPGVR